MADLTRGPLTGPPDEAGGIGDRPAPAITAGELFARLQSGLELRWAAGRSGRERRLAADASPRERPSLAGFLNLVHANHVQVLGLEELRHLDTLDARKRWETVAQVVGDRPVALVVSDNLPIPNDLLDSAEESGTPLWTSPLRGVDVVGHLQHLLARILARSTTVHGVFMEVFSMGVLITGESGAGKSELALELITRGHRLVADDAPVLTRIAPDVIAGTCPPMLEDCLEVRGLGILNVRSMFGDAAIKRTKYLRLVVRLDVSQLRGEPPRAFDRLYGDISERELLGLAIPEITVPVAPGRNLAVLVEAAVRNQALKLNGYDAAADFVRRHDRFLREADADR